MCTVITLIAATDDLAGVNAVLATMDGRGRSRRAEPAASPDLHELLAADERAYRLTRSPCDCGTFLGHAAQGEDDAERAADLARYRRKGWSEARIERALADKARAASRPARRPPNEDAAYWVALMTALAEELALERVGLMHRFHDDARGAGPEAPTRRPAGSIEGAADTLAVMPEAVVHDFTARIRS